MKKLNFNYLCLFSLSFIYLDKALSFPIHNNKNEITNNIPYLSSIDNANISIQNNGLIYLKPDMMNKAFTPNNSNNIGLPAGYTGNINQFDEFFITLNDKYGNKVFNEKILDLISIQIDEKWLAKNNYSWIGTKKNGKVKLSETCRFFKFEPHNYGIKFVKTANYLTSLTTCQFIVKSKNQNKLKFKDNEVKILLKFNYSFEDWVNLNLSNPEPDAIFNLNADSLPSVKFAKHVKSLVDEKNIELSFQSPTLFETLDLSSIYNLDIFPNLEKLKIEGYRIHPTFSNSFAFPKASMLKELIFTRNIIPIVPSSSFVNLENLEKIWLVGNRIESIHKEAFLGLNSLDEINLDYNPLFKPQENSFDKLTNLKKLSLSNCQIKNLPKDFLKGLENLIKLDLRFNHISSWDKELFINTPSLVDLNLSNNNITKISNTTFDNLKNLEKIDLNNNKIESPILIGKLLNLKHLDISKNQINKIDDSSFINLARLNKLIASENKIDKISDLAFNNNNKIEKIDLRANLIEKIPKINSHDLKDFLLSGNSISQIYDQEFDSSPNIETLELSNNKISYISENAFSYQQKLTSLNLGKNYIDYISYLTFSSLPNLHSLWLNDNKITKIEDYTFYYLTNLKFLALSSNPIQDLSAVSFIGLNNLNELWLDVNDSSILPNNIFSKNDLPEIKRVLLNNITLPL